MLYLCFQSTGHTHPSQLFMYIIPIYRCCTCVPRALDTPTLLSILCILFLFIDVVPVFPEHWTHPPFSACKDKQVFTISCHSWLFMIKKNGIKRHSRKGFIVFCKDSKIHFLVKNFEVIKNWLKIGLATSFFSFHSFFIF